METKNPINNASINPSVIQKFVKSLVFYLGVMNEGGYERFSINRTQQVMEKP
jgi:hypothetical protein